MKFLDYSGLQRFLDRLKAIIPTKTSHIQNDSGYLNTQGVQNYMENGGGYSQSYIDTALSGKADSSHTHGNITNDGKVGTTANLPLITGTGGVVQAGSFGNAANTFCEGNDSRLSDARTPVAHTHTKSDVTDLFNSANTWSEEQILSKGMCLNGDRNAYIYPMWGGAASGIAFLVMDGSKQFVFGQRTTDASNRFRYDSTKGYLVIRTGETDGSNFVEAVPYGADTRLGTSTNRWKTLNGINPGALSLPDYSDTTYIDISGSIVPPSGETEINKNLGFNEYTPPIDGWLSIRCDGATFLQIYRNSYNCPGITSCDPRGGKLVVTLPVRKNVTYTIRIKTSGTTNLYQLYPCQGNV